MNNIDDIDSLPIFSVVPDSSTESTPSFEEGSFEEFVHKVLTYPSYSQWENRIRFNGEFTLLIISQFFRDNPDLSELFIPIGRALVEAAIDIHETDISELQQINLSTRINLLDNRPVFNTLYNTNIPLSIVAAKSLESRSITDNSLSEADWYFFKRFVKGLNTIYMQMRNRSRLLDELFDLADNDFGPSKVSPINIHIFIKIYPPRRKEIWHTVDHFVGLEDQKEFLEEELSKGSMGFTKEKADTSRAIMGNIGKILQSLIYFQLWEGAIKKFPDELLPYKKAIDLINSSTGGWWEEFKGERAIEYFKDFFEGDGPLNELYYYTCNIVAWWLIKQLPLIKDYGYKIESVNEDAIDIQVWIKNNTGLDISTIASAFNLNPEKQSESYRELIENIQYIFNGFPSTDDPFPSSPVNKVPEKVLTRALIDLVNIWLKENHEGLIYSITYSLIALTRAIKPQFLSSIRKGTYLTEVYLDNGNDADLRSDIIVIPKGLKFNPDKHTLADLPECTIDLFEIKLERFIHQNPPRKFLEQILSYIESIKKINPKLKVRPFLLQISGMGINLVDVSSYLAKLEIQKRKKKKVVNSTNSDYTLDRLENIEIVEF